MNEPQASSAAWDVNPSNLAWVEELYLAFKADASSVADGWRKAFERLERGEPFAPPLTEPALVPSAPSTGHPAAAGAGAPASRVWSDTAAPVSAARATAATANAAPANAGPLTGDIVRNGQYPSIVTGAGASSELAATAAQRALEGKRVRQLVEDYRAIGHLSARLDPLGLFDRSKNRLRLSDYGLEESDLDRPMTAEEIGGLGTVPLREIITHLDETYCRTIGVELAHIHDAELRGWLLQRVEVTRNRMRLSRSERLQLLARVTEAEVFEQFLQTKFIGAKRFSLEGAESLIPLLDRVTERAAQAGVTQIVIGMPHRGRLNVLANVMGKPAAEIFAEFLDSAASLQGDQSGDVKYHLGYSMDRVTPAGKVHMSLAFNPSHLEFVNPVVQGRARAKQDRMGDTKREHGLPILLHGDAAFAGQGIVYEVFNMSGLEGYQVGGTIHVIVNNQIGFTTAPQNAYSMTYPSDMARMLQVPIFHVNGEDPEAIAQVVDIAVDFRQRFKRDVVIDMWCYRKLGHNEADEPNYTQPVMYRAIASKPSIRQAYIDAFGKMTDQGESPITADDAERAATARRQALEEALDQAKRFTNPPRPSTFAGIWSRVRGGPDSAVREVPTAVSSLAIETVGRALATVPGGFHPHPKIHKLLETRAAMAVGKKPIDWGMGELLAFGTLLGEGIRVRFSGQDVRRGTFSHRHAVLIDHENGIEYTPLSQVAEGQATFEIRDSLLSEAGVLGFEYGYSLDSPDGLVLWEAQFGDFVNGAQVIIDQFLVSSEAKWRRVSGLVMLLPHGMEGQGPEHSSGRLERFLNMCVNDNIQVCNVTTPAQMFHLLRRQVLRPYRKPLIVMTPKNLLRHPKAVSAVDDFTSGGFQHVIPDFSDINPADVNRVLLCSGKVYYDLLAAREAAKVKNVAIIRIEQLYPLRVDEVLEALSVYKEGSRVIWVQEEARNNGAWHYMSRVLPPLLLASFRWSGISRPLSASPATGSKARHELEQAKLLEEALGLQPGSIRAGGK